MRTASPARWLMSLVALLGAGGGSARAQGLEFEVGRLFETPDWNIYRFGYSAPIAGPLGYSLAGTHLGETGSGGAGLWGPDLTLSLFRGGRPGLYLLGGVAGGLATGDGDRLWGSWVAGLGYEIRPAGFLSLAARANWRNIGYEGTREGVEFGVHLGVLFGGGGSGPSPSRARSLPPIIPPGTSDDTLAAIRGTIERSGVGGSSAETITAVLSTAVSAMGTPYKWGGNGAEDGGFDCSGLIQYAYATQGISLPRRSVDQARQGERVEKRLDALLPGDILAFSNKGGPVTHVGLYLGEGRFIHSANDGVQISRLSADDTYGRWWWRRWVGARRIVQ
ncbi:MAG: NlpC/P60 family protein [Gemmatimonadales bacterium]